MSNLGNVTGPAFIVPIVVLIVGTIAGLVVHIDWLRHTDETSIGCVIARASLPPGGLNALVITVSVFSPGGSVQ